MRAEQWAAGRRGAGLTQIQAAAALGVSQPYLSQIEKGLREASQDLSRKASRLYRLSPSTLPVHDPAGNKSVRTNRLQREIASLGYPAFEHIRTRSVRNPAEVVLDVVAQPDLDPRMVEAVPWVLSNYADLDWTWLRDNVKLRNAQNRLGYLIHLARENTPLSSNASDATRTLSAWEQELDDARLAGETTLCRDSMPAAERAWVRMNRPIAAAYWNLLTTLTANQLPYALK